MSETTIQITGMSCQHCVGAVTKALQAVPGVERAEVDLGAGSARVRGSAAPQTLVDAVVGAGYEARVAG